MSRNAEITHDTAVMARICRSVT